MDTPEFSFRELGALFDQSPIAMVFLDRELRARRANAALRRLFGLPDEAIIGRRSSEIDHGVDAAWIERTSSTCPRNWPSISRGCCGSVAARSAPHAGPVR